MYSKFIKLIVLVSVLVCCRFAGRVLYGHLSQECRTRGRSTSHFSGASNTTAKRTAHECECGLPVNMHAVMY